HLYVTCDEHAGSLNGGSGSRRNFSERDPFGYEMASPDGLGRTSWGSGLLTATTSGAGWRPGTALRTRAGASPAICWLLLAALLAAAAVGVGEAGGSAPRGAGPHTQKGWAGVPVAARAPVSSAIGSADR